MWGLITSLNDILIPYLKALFELSYFEAMLIQFCFFGAYFVMSFPSGFLVEKAGYRRGIIIGLLVAGVGCLGFYPAASLHVVSAVSPGALRARVGHHAAPGRRQSLRRDPGRAGDGREPVEPDAGLQFPGDDGRSLGRVDPDPVDRRDRARCECRAASVPDPGGDALSHRPRIRAVSPACRQAPKARRPIRSPRRRPRAASGGTDPWCSAPSRSSSTSAPR